jgi:hypothetical protein
MTGFLASDTHPNGFKLEDLLLSLRREVAARMQKIMDYVRPEARLVVDNDVRILQLRTQPCRRLNGEAQSFIRPKPDGRWRHTSYRAPLRSSWLSLVSVRNDRRGKPVRPLRRHS